MAHFRGRLRTGRCVGFATARARRPMPRRHGRETVSRSMATMPSPCDRERWRIGKSSSQPARIPPPERIVYLWSLDAQMAPTWRPTDALLHLTQALESAQPAAKLRIDLVTRERAARGPRSATDRGRAGAGHRIDARHSRTNIPISPAARIDLPPDASAADATLLWSELLRKDARTRNRVPRRSSLRAATRPRPSVRASNGSIRRCRCVSNPASAAISTRCASRRSSCRRAGRAKC